MSKEKGNPTYVGRIGNGGTQHVEAPLAQKEIKGAKVHQGNDLRSKKK